MVAPEGTGLESTSLSDPILGASVIGYVLKARLGVGGMGVVYEAEESTIGRRAAVKVLLPEIAAQTDFVQRLIAEARAANAVRHRGIVDIFGFGTLPDGRQCIVMELLEGQPLDQLLSALAIDGRRLPLLRTIALLDEVAAALGAAHTAGVVHRDLKPSNIFLCRQADGEEFVKLLDFGIAKLGGGGLQLGPKTATNVVMGTPAYMSPEQGRGGPAAPSMDLYSLGVIAFELFTGRVPFTSGELVQTLLDHQNTPPPRPSALAPELPAAVDEVVLRLLEKEPPNRYRDAAELRTALQRLRATLGDPGARTTNPSVTKYIPPSVLVAPDVAPPKPSSPRPRPSSPPATKLSPRADAPTAIVTREPARPPPVEPGPPTGSRPGLLLAVAALAVLGVAALAVILWPVKEPPAEVDQPLVVQPIAVPTPPVQPAAVPVVVVPPPVEDAGAARPPAPAEAITTKSPTSADDPLTLEKRRLEKRAATLTTRLDAARARGESVDLERQQLDAIKKALKGSATRKTLTQLDIALERLERDTQ